MSTASGPSLSRWASLLLVGDFFGSLFWGDYLIQDIDKTKFTKLVDPLIQILDSEHIPTSKEEANEIKPI